jgi:predicted transcriptional regulator
MAEDTIPESAKAPACPSDAAQIVIAYLTNFGRQLKPEELPGLISEVYAAVGRGGHPAPVEMKPEPAVPIERSIGPDFLVCLEDGVRLKMLKRYLAVQHNMTPEQYRAKWGLPPDYPMVSADYSAQRREIAKQQGLGRKAPAVPRKARAATSRRQAAH